MDSDMRWLWFAYEMGEFREFVDAGLSIDAFTERMLDVIGSTPYEWVLEARGDEGLKPVGIILATNMSSGRAIEPFVQWFPWATTRNQVESTAAFLKVVSKQFKIFVFAENKARDFWEKMVRYGLIHRGCKVLDHFSPKEDAMMYYTAGPL